MKEAGQKRGIPADTHGLSMMCISAEPKIREHMLLIQKLRTSRETAWEATPASTPRQRGHQERGAILVHWWSAPERAAAPREIMEMMFR